MKPRSLVECRRHLLRDWKPLHGLALSGVNRPLIASRLGALVKTNGPVPANRARATLSAFFSWAIGEGRCDNNPVIGTNKQSEKQRERVLTDDELIMIWHAAPENAYGRIVKLLMLTAQRREEIGGLRWSELQPSEKALIALPGSRTKNARAHDVPLSAAAVDVLKAQPRIFGRDLVFGEGEGGYSGWSKAKSAWTKHVRLRTGRCTTCAALQRHAWPIWGSSRISSRQC